MKKQIAVLLAAALAVVTACGGGDDEEPAAEATATEESAPSSGATGETSATGGTAEAPSEGGSGGTLVIAMTATNIPGLDTMQFQSEGGEGGRFVGVQLWDGLTRFDLTQGESTPEVIPGLADSWEVSDDKLTWTFKLKEGVTFHDGEPWNADAAIFNYDRYLNKDSATYIPELNAVAGILLAGIESAAKVDDMTISITTAKPMADLPSMLALGAFGSPKAITEMGDSFAEHPVGTGPFKFESLQRGQELVLVKNENYYRGAPKLDKLILRPVPEVTTRMAGLRSGEFSWIEVPSPDEVPALESEGYQVLTNYYSHIWPWVLDTTKPPFDDVKVRQAINYAIDRDAMADALLQGTGAPATQYIPPSDPGYTPDQDTFTYDPEKAKALLAEAGYPDGFEISLSFPTSGSGNMIPIPMNETLQRDLEKVGITVTLEPIEWGAMLGDFFVGKIPGEAEALNISLGFVLPSLWSTWFHSTSGINAGKFSDPKVDELLDAVSAEFDPAKQAALYNDLNAALIESSPWLLVVSDLNPRVLAPNVEGFVMPRSWYVDLTNVTVS
jgi:peptide/nickel transport system substrate-binding protein